MSGTAWRRPKPQRTSGFWYTITLDRDILITLMAGRILDFFVDHLSEFLAALDLNQRFELVGYFMGGIAADFLQTFRRLVLLALAGICHAIASKWYYLLHMPMLGN